MPISGGLLFIYAIMDNIVYMNGESKNWCEKIMKRLKRKHLYNFFMLKPLGVMKECDFSRIEEKLGSSKYLSVFDWSLDVYELAKDIKNSYSTDKIMSYLIDDFLFWFDIKLSRRCENFKEKRIKSIEKCMLKLKKIEMAAKSIYFPKTTVSSEISDLQGLIDANMDQKIQLEIYSILKKDNPLLVVNPVTYVDYESLSSGCIEDITKILKEANV